MKAPKFENRWIITGTLTTKSELHIGDGFAQKFCARFPNDKAYKDNTHDYQTVCTDVDGHAFLPSTSIRGPLRDHVRHLLDEEKPKLAAWWKANKHRKHEDREKTGCPWTELFGSDDADADYGLGGKLTIFDAFVADPENDEPPFSGPDDFTHPYWCKVRRTCVATSVCIDRRTRTAADKLLYQSEYVPKGQKFTLRLGGDNLEENEVGLLLGLLQQFNGENGIKLGAQGSHSWGRMKWDQGSVQKLTRDDMLKWRDRANGSATGFGLADKLVAVESVELNSATPAKIVIDLELQFLSPWLVRDPKQKARHEADNSKPNAIPFQNTDGKPFLPAKAVRGVLRSQAEMILRTLFPGDFVGFGKNVPKQRDDVFAENLAAQIFGLSGWKSPLVVHPFTCKGEAKKSLHQEFVAIDRFTGGAAESAKFDAEFARPTTLSGKLIFDASRLRREAVENPPFLGLLALVLRDLKEGDIAPGSKAAAGAGLCTCTATVNHVGTKYDSLEKWFASQPVKAALASLRTIQPSRPAHSHA